MTRFKNVLPAVFLSLLFVSCANLPVHQSHKVEKEEAGDMPGDDVGWYDSESKLMYSVCHDADDLYLNLVFLDPMALMSLKMGGLNIIWIPRENRRKSRYFVFL